MKRISVIVTTYNRPAALDKVLASLAVQNLMPHEVIVADDGSRQETAELVQSWQARFPCPLLHIWQADEGFRAARVRNLAVAASTGDYLIFTDGDCLAFPNFVRRHHALSENGRFVAGSRILLSRELTQAVESGAEHPQSWRIGRWLHEKQLGQVNRLLPMLHIPGRRWRLLRSRDWRGARTCNLALWRADFISINGFDESFQGWGHEDAELVVRLIRHGVLRKEGRFAVTVLHLWHKESDRSSEAENRRRLQDVIEGHPL